MECMKTTTLDENNAATSSRGNEEEQQDKRQQQQQHESGLATAKVAAAGDVATLPLLCSLAQNTSLMLSTRKESGVASELAGRSWSSVVASGAAAAIMGGVSERARRGGPTFSSAGVSHDALQRGDNKKQAQEHTQGLVSIGQARGAAVVQEGGVMDASKVPQRASERGDSMQAPLPWIPAEKAGAAGVQAVTVSSHADADPAGSQRGQPSINTAQQASYNNTGEQRTGGLMEDLQESRREEVPAQHTEQSSHSSRVSPSTGGVVPSLPPSAHCSDRRSEVVEPHGSLSLSFPVGMHPPTPHMGPLGMRGDGR
jgi:hypothetical protein